MIEQFPTVEFFKTIPILALTQFGHWDEILDEPMPPTKLPTAFPPTHTEECTPSTDAVNRLGDATVINFAGWA